MRSLFILFPLLMISVGTMQAQDRKVEQFINDIYHDIVPVSHKYYYLLDTGHATHARASLVAHKAFPYVTKLDSNFTKEIIDKFNSPDTPILWSSYLFKDAVIIPNNQADSMFDNGRSIELIDYRFYEKNKDSLKKTKPWSEIYAPVNFKWSKKKKMQVLDAYADSLDQSIPAERHSYFRFSRPVFTNDDKYAMIWYGEGEHNYCLFIYRSDENGQWKFYQRFFAFAKYVINLRPCSVTAILFLSTTIPYLCPQ
jgi:hypothetical protein